MSKPRTAGTGSQAGPGPSVARKRAERSSASAPRWYAHLGRAALMYFIAIGCICAMRLRTHKDSVTTSTSAARLSSRSTTAPPKSPAGVQPMPQPEMKSLPEGYSQCRTCNSILPVDDFAGLLALGRGQHALKCLKCAGGPVQNPDPVYQPAPTKPPRTRKPKE